MTWISLSNNNFDTVEYKDIICVLYYQPSVDGGSTVIEIVGQLARSTPECIVLTESGNNILIPLSLIKNVLIIKGGIDEGSN